MGWRAAERRERELLAAEGPMGPDTARDFHWGGTAGTYFWGDPREELAVVFMAAAPAARLRPRQLLPVLVLQAIMD